MNYLLAISVGPVQEFIAAARRTRDLWFGSYLLSEISRAVARTVEQHGGQLIFPADTSAENVANVVVAELSGADPKNVARAAKEAAIQQFEEFAEAARKQVADAIRDDIWEDQVHDVIEFYAAWVPYEGDYPAARARLMRLLAGRKSCRDFLPARGRQGVPKSSLDGLRETVLKDPKVEPWPSWIRRRMRLREGEQLDVVGVTKRLGKQKNQREPRYPSVARIAADPWVRGNKDKPAFRQIAEICKRLGPEIVHRLDEFPQFKDFPYEGTAVYPSRHHEWFEETGLTADDVRELREALKELPEAAPYLAVLVADGDRMGAVISALRTPEENRKFSRTLAEFANKVKEIVEAHHGVLVYAGGDDVLAFVPVDQCLECARELHDQFAVSLQGYCTEGGSSPTLSVGIAIGHFLENLEDLLEYGRAAEKCAKGPDRNGLAVHLYKRGGAPVRTRSSWNENPDQRMLTYARWLAVGAIPGGFPHELHRLVDLYAKWSSSSDPVGALQRDAIRIIRDKQPRSARSLMPEIEARVKELNTVDQYGQLARELLIARQIAVALKQAGSVPQAQQREDAA